MLRHILSVLICSFLLLLNTPQPARAVPSAGAVNSSLSADGRYIAFDAVSSDLVSGDTNGWSDIFVRDRETGEITRVSVASDGTQANNSSNNPMISGNGRYVAFASSADNLAPGNPDFFIHVFVHDRQTGETTRVSVSSAGTQGNGVSGGAFITYDGRYVVFTSEASNLVTGDTNNRRDVFMHDRQTGETTRLSVTSTGAQANSESSGGSLSADLRYLVFSSWATNLVPNDTNSASDVFVRDMQTGEISRVSVTSAGTQANDTSGGAVISADGRFVAFYAYTSDLVSGDTNGTGDIFEHDRQTGQTTRVSVSSTGAQGTGGLMGARGASITGDGRFVVFTADFTNLVANDTNGYDDVFLHDRQTGETTRISVSASGAQGDWYSGAGSITSDGRWITFVSGASNLVAGDDFGADIFVLDRQTGELTRESVPPMLVPSVTSPADGATANTDKPTFKWSSVNGVAHYDIRLDTVDPPIRQFNTGKSTQFIPAVPLLPLPYFWQVRAVGSDGRISPWSAVRSLTINLPANAAPIRNFFDTPTVSLTWNTITGAVTYEIQVDDTSGFSGILAFEQTISAPTLTVTTTPLTNGTYYWRVRGCNGTCGVWSVPILFAVID